MGRDPAKWHVTISTTAAASLWPMVHFDLPTQLPVTSLWWNSLWSLLGLAIAGLSTVRLLGTRPYRAPAMLAGIVFAFLLMTGGGGGANVTAPPTPPPIINTPLGTHTITVTASSGSFTQSFDVTLDVQ